MRDPARIIPRAVRMSLAITLAVYATVAVAALACVGPDGLASAPAPLTEVVLASGRTGLGPVVQAGAVAAALGSLLSLILGVSRTTLSMARDGYLPATLAAVHRGRGATACGAGGGRGRRRGGRGGRHSGRHQFSSFAVLLYYGIANASAWTLEDGVRPRLIPVAGLAGCLLLAFTLPHGSVAAGLTVVAIGAAVYGITGRFSGPGRPPAQWATSCTCCPRRCRSGCRLTPWHHAAPV